MQLQGVTVESAVKDKADLADRRCRLLPTNKSDCHPRSHHKERCYIGI